MTINLPRFVGFDIGGAHIKAASDEGLSACLQFPLWKQPQDLHQAVHQLAQTLGPATHYVATMTGELADCFFDRREGVAAIVDQTVQALGERVKFYALDGRFVDADEACSDDLLVAASNWHAIASLAAQWCGGDGLLIDIGSTTSDFIPVRQGRVATPSRTDHERLLRGELDYAGVGRTPVCALVDGLPFLGQLVPVMNEVFATTDDCLLLTGSADDDPSDLNTCDGRPRTARFAANRLARMIGLDHRQVTLEDAQIMAAYVLDRLRARWTVACQVLSTPSATWILSGHGSGLIQVPADRACLDLSALLGPSLSRVAPAYSVARLALAAEASVDAVPVMA